MAGLEVDDQLVFVRLLNGQVAGFRTLEDAIDVTCCLPVLVKLFQLRTSPDDHSWERV